MSTRSSSLVPTNLFNWPECVDLLPDQKLIFGWLWSNDYIGCGGFGFVPARPAAATLGLSPDALLGGLRDLQNRECILFDEKTAEIFILKWFRTHHFKTPVSLNILKAQIEKIESKFIKEAVLLKSMSCFPTATAAATATPSLKAAAAIETGKFGVIIKNEEDQVKFNVLLEKFGEEQIKTAVNSICAKKSLNRPFISNLEKELRNKKNNSSVFQIDIDSCRAGEAYFKNGVPQRRLL